MSNPATLPPGVEFATPLPPPVPVGPVISNLASWIAYFAGLVIFVLGLLTATGVVVPTGISVDVQMWAGALESLVGVLAPLFVLWSRHKVAVALLEVGVPLHEGVGRLGL